jgi:hypothetical protein
MDSIDMTTMDELQNNEGSAREREEEPEEKKEMGAEEEIPCTNDALPSQCLIAHHRPIAPKLCAQLPQTAPNPTQTGHIYLSRSPNPTGMEAQLDQVTPHCPQQAPNLHPACLTLQLHP